MTAVGAGALVAGCSSETADVTTTTAPGARARGRVVVVGAGLAGLVAAWDLQAHDVEVVVLEAAGRAGGRVRTVGDRFVEGQHGELGAEFVDANDHATLDLLADLALDVTDAAPPVRGADVVVAAPGVPTAATLAQYLALDAGAVGADLARWTEVVRTTAARVDPDDPTSAPDAPALDSLAVSTLLDQVLLHPGARFLVERGLVARYGTSSEGISTLFLAQQSAREGERAAPGGRSFRVTDGTDAIVSRLVAGLRGVVVADAAVVGVRQSGTGVSVEHGGGSIAGDAVVLAAPLPALPHIRFDPPPPDALVQATGVLGYGRSVVTLLQYGSRPWQAGGLSGSATCGTQVATTSALDTSAGAAGIITAVSGGSDAAALGVTGEQARVAQAAGTVDVFLPGSSAGVVGSASIVWHDDAWVGGRGVVFGPGQVLPYWDVLRRPFGRVHPAGEHTDSWCGTMEGAIRSGHRAAAAIIDALGG